ncbi:amino acid ABC transporter permease [Rhizobium laguerreae]|uniref:amino acid ABC transporter permease n=1 Tax=Rhizobium laguerreae TaxID=1076926 RepID=UPI001C916502|nr:amino acid ABC transporter permease [Rhizobium laguerreae]MBY3381803.1 amino acid ABC transporter permease [Rhizobium laguerreae]
MQNAVSPGTLSDNEPALEVIPLKNNSLRVLIVVVTAIALAVFYGVITNENFQWEIVWKYFFSAAVLKGLLNTISLTIIGMAIGMTVGLILAFLRLSPSKFLAGCAAYYIWIFRGTPLLVQIILLYNISILYPTISIGIPFGPTFVTWDTNSVVTPFLAAILALGLNEAAFMCEVIRGGLLSVDSGQTEAAQALGMRKGLIRRRIVIPQAMRSILPPTGNQFISLMKATSMVSVIASYDLLYSVQTIYSRTFETIPLLLVATIWYLVIVSLLMVVQVWIERRYSKGATRNQPLQQSLISALFKSKGAEA